MAMRAGAGWIATLEARLAGQERSGSALVAEMLAELGVPAARILVEERTRSTREEAVRFAELAHTRRARRALVLTAAYHVPRAARLFAEAGVPGVVHAPDALWRLANPTERGWIAAGRPHEAAVRDEARTESLLGALELALAPLPSRARAWIEIAAGAAWRDVRR